MKKTRKNDSIALLFLATLFFYNHLFAQDPVVTKDYSTKISSKIFNQERDIFIQHMYYDFSPADSVINKTPVILIFDPELLYQYTAGLIKFSQNKMDLPSFILVGIPNKGRAAELGVESDGRFSKFVNIEVDSVLTQLFPNRGGLHAIGHSSGADFILYKNIDNLNSACILSGLLFTKEDYYSFNEGKKIPMYCYSGTEDSRLQFVVNLNTLKGRDSSSYSNITTKIFDDRDHFDIPLGGIEDYVKKFFRPLVNLTEKEIEVIALSSNKTQMLDSIVHAKNELYQCDYTPSIQDIMAFEEVVSPEEFHSFFTHILSYDLKAMTKLFALYSLGEHYEEQKDFEKALLYFQKMYETIVNNPQMKPQVDAAVQRVEEQMNMKKGSKKKKA